MGVGVTDSGASCLGSGLRSWTGVWSGFGFIFFWVRVFRYVCIRTDIHTYVHTDLNSTTDASGWLCPGSFKSQDTVLCLFLPPCRSSNGGEHSMRVALGIA